MSMTYRAAGMGTCDHSGMTIPSFPSSEMHLEKFPDHTECQSWIVNFRTEVARCSGSRKSKQPNHWMTPKSITGKDFPDCEELDLMMASALKRCYVKQTHFRKKISVEEQRAQKDNRFLTRREISYLIYEYFRPAGSFEIQGLSGLFSIELGNDDIQDFDLRWEQALLLTSDLSIGQGIRRSVRLQVARFLPSSDIGGTFQSRHSAREEENDIITDWECV